MAHVALPSALRAALNAAELVVVPTEAAAHTLRAQLHAARQERQAAVLAPANILTWEQWTLALWRTVVLEGVEHRLLLTRVQEEALWAEVIQTSARASAFSRQAVQELAMMARSGWALATAFAVADTLLGSADSVDTQAFAAWSEHFSRILAEQHLLSVAALEENLAAHVLGGTLDHASPVHLFGHTRFTPAQRRLLDALEASGVPVRTHTGPEAPGAVVDFFVASDAEAELQLAVRQAHRWLAETRDPDALTAIVLPETFSQKAALERVLKEVFAPALNSLKAEFMPVPWQWAQSEPLAAQPCVRSAVQLLRWVLQPLPLEAVGQLLLSPAFAHGDSLEARSRFEAQVLRRTELLQPELPLAALFGLHRARPYADAVAAQPEWSELRALHAYAAQHALARARLPPSAWVQHTRTLLQRVGWLTTRDLSPTEQAALHSWQRTLDALRALDLWDTRLSFATFLDDLTRELGLTKLTMPESHARLHLLTLAQAEGALFHTAIVLGATEKNLPGPEQAHPLLSRALQRSLGLPSADPNAALERTHAALEQLTRSCRNVLFTASRGDESELSCLSTLPQAFGTEPKIVPDAPSFDIDPPISLITFEDRSSLPPLPVSLVEGGATVLQLQAACGFRAFASLRLQAGVLESRTLGVDARETGNLLHRALEHFWRTVKTQARLRAMPEVERKQAVRQAVAEAFAQRYQPKATAWNQAFLSTLEQRFERVVMLWLHHELERAPFTVLPPEEEQYLQVGPLELKIRPDRVDMVEDGCVFVDYKTSASMSTSDWMGARPEAPQLPLYSLLAEPQEVRGLAFARVRPGKDMAWLSLSDLEALFPRRAGKRVETLTDQIELWRTELERLAWEFANGRAEVDPKRHPHTCLYCPQRLLCRLDPSALAAQNAEPAPETGTEPHG